MNIQDLTHYFLQYGAFFIYLIVLLEYLNLPGFPAGVIMPLAGIWARRRDQFSDCYGADSCSRTYRSWALYLLGRYGGNKVLRFYFKKFPKHQPVIEEKMNYLREKGCIGVFVSKLLPMVRTLISDPGRYGEDGFCQIYSEFRVRIFLWNLTFVGAGYFFGDAAIKLFT